MSINIKADQTTVRPKYFVVKLQEVKVMQMPITIIIIVSVTLFSLSYNLRDPNEVYICMQINVNLSTVIYGYFPILNEY